jgi:hypothetical protein
MKFSAADYSSFGYDLEFSVDTSFLFLLLNHNKQQDYGVFKILVF